MQRTMKENSHEFDPRKFFQADEAQKVCIECFEVFGSAGQAPDIHPIDLEVMAQRDKAGTLRQVVH
jgi:fructose-bisphosphate aldolase, class II